MQKRRFSTGFFIGLFTLGAVAFAAGPGGVMGLKSADGKESHAVTVHESPDGGGAGEWKIRDNEQGCEEAELTIVLGGDPLCITSCTAPTGFEQCCTDLENWCMAFFRKIEEKEVEDTDPEPNE
jgi:hypothetical protein